jgi:hypothetical protein
MNTSITEEGLQQVIFNNDGLCDVYFTGMRLKIGYISTRVTLPLKMLQKKQKWMGEKNGKPVSNQC